LDLDLKEYLKDHNRIRAEVAEELILKLKEKKKFYDKKLEKKKVKGGNSLFDNFLEIREKKRKRKGEK
jgi:hypothetical protein